MATGICKACDMRCDETEYDWDGGYCLDCAEKIVQEKEEDKRLEEHTGEMYLMLNKCRKTFASLGCVKLSGEIQRLFDKIDGRE